jgi:serine/threonine-protein kinase HipA
MMVLPQRIREVGVHAFGEPAGVLSQPAQYMFQCTGEQPVSLTMDIREAPYNFGAVHPVFGQNLPEGYVRRYIHEKLLRHAEVNDLYLLGIQSDKGIGHLAFTSEIYPSTSEQLSLQDILTWQGEEALFPQLLERYYLNGLISGVQPKVLVPVQEKSVISQADVIVKTFDEEYDLLTVNEFVCMSAAKACGLSPPNFYLSDDKRCFVIERFDRRDGISLAFEDFTVLMGKSSEHKYQSSYETLLKAMAAFTRSQAEVERGYQYIVFSCLIGNGDAHLKNFAVQYEADRNEVLLAPPYDVTHTLIYDTLDNNMALKMAGAKSFPDRDTLIKLGQGAGIKKTEQITEAIADQIQDYLADAAELELLTGFKVSLETALAKARIGFYSVSPFRHDKKRKHPF